MLVLEAQKLWIWPPSWMTRAGNSMRRVSGVGRSRLRSGSERRKPVVLVRSDCISVI